MVSGSVFFAKSASVNSDTPCQNDEIYSGISVATYCVASNCYAPVINITTGRLSMEVITIGGLAILAVGGYYSVIDFINDLGFGGRRVEAGAKNLPISQHYIIARQPGIKKMARMYI